MLLKEQTDVEMRWWLCDILVGPGRGELLQPVENPPTPAGNALSALLPRFLPLVCFLPPPPRLGRGRLRRAHRRDGVRRARAHQAGSQQQPQPKLPIQKVDRLLLRSAGARLLEPRDVAYSAPRRSRRAPRVHLRRADDAQANEAPRGWRRRPGAAARRGRGGARRARRRAGVRVEHAARRRPPWRLLGGVQ
jgi:hypothetical protein